MIGSSGVKKDEHGAEVMEIDVDEVEGEEKRETGESEKVAEGQVKGVLSLTTTSEVTVKAKSSPKSTPAGSKPASGANTPILPSSPSTASTLTAKNGVPAEKPKVSAVQLKRTASPTPSVKKANATPPPPNLLLPTWGDTFHTAPRNIVPPPPPSHARGDNVSVGSKLFGKTIKFVSGVLFANDAPVMSAKGKERERESLLEKERRERFVGIGRDLPKAWGVLRAAGWDVDSGAGMKGDARGIRNGAASFTGRESLGGDVDGGLGEEGMSNVLRGCKRVVVIGVHGWFPG